MDNDEFRRLTPRDGEPAAPAAADLPAGTAPKPSRRSTKATIIGSLAVGGLAGAAILGPLSALAASTPPSASTAAQSPSPSASATPAETTAPATTAAPHATNAPEASEGTEASEPHGRGGHVEAVSDTSVVAKAIGISEADLLTALNGGQTAAQVATAHGVAVQTVIDALVADGESELAADVASGQITQAQADAEKSEITQRATDQVNGSLGNR